MNKLCTRSLTAIPGIALPLGQSQSAQVFASDVAR
jgi:hypothetical protein